MIHYGHYICKITRVSGIFDTDGAVRRKHDDLIMHLTHSFLTAKQLFPGFFIFFYAIFRFLRLEHDCYAKFTSCST